MLFPFTKTKPDPVAPLSVAGVEIRPSLRARRMALRVDTATGDVILVLPKRVSVKRATAFILENEKWIDSQRQKQPARQSFHDGMMLTVAGRDYTVVHRAGRGVTKFEDDKIVVRGDPAFFARRLRDFLKKEAQQVLARLSLEKAAQIGVSPVQVRVADPRTRWGSCSHDGKLMYSWRLVLAPPAVMDYVVAHEVAHRRHMNHSRKFWDLCYKLCASGDGETARAWLRQHGAGLMVYR